MPRVVVGEAVTEVAGAVWLDAPQLAAVLGGEDSRAAVRAIVMHELGHVERLAALGRGRCF